jgi:hypothetical protein
MKRSTLGLTVACSLVAADIHVRIIDAQRPATDVSGPGGTPQSRRRESELWAEPDPA